MITKSDAIIKVADDLKQAHEGNLPQNCTTETAIQKLMEIFKQEAKDYVRLKNVPRQRVSSEENDTSNQRVITTPHRNENVTPSQRVDITPLDVKYAKMPSLVPPGRHVISQEEEPQRRTRPQTNSITQKMMPQTMEIS